MKEKMMNLLASLMITSLSLSQRSENPVHTQITEVRERKELSKRW